MTTILLFSSISAEFGSGGGVGFGFRIGAGGGAPSCGAMRRPGPVCSTGVAVGCGDGVADAEPVWRGRESGCCAPEAPTIKREIAMSANPKERTTARRPENDCWFSNLITTKPSLNKCAMSNHFREQERYFQPGVKMRGRGAKLLGAILECAGLTPLFRPSVGQCETQSAVKPAHSKLS